MKTIKEKVDHYTPESHDALLEPEIKVTGHRQITVDLTLGSVADARWVLDTLQEIVRQLEAA